MKKALKLKNIGTGYLYFYIHFIVEIICFFYLSRVTNNSHFVWLVPFVYDAIAFVPQSLIGYISDRYPKINMGYIGIFLLILAIIIYSLFNVSTYISLIILCLGNAFLHVSGAEVTLKTSEGKLSHSAIFVAGGSFGVISGKLLAKTSINPLYMIFLALTMIPFIMLADTYVTKNSNTKKFDYVNPKINKELIVLLAVFIVFVRGYMGYGIPTSWNKTTLQTIIFFCTMGFGKALGGILSDRFGIRKIAKVSTLGAIPFLCFGDNIMLVSIIGVMMFSMTMSITLGILVSVLKKNPGLAFGHTTIGLFLGTAPIFFIKITSIYINIGMIIVFSILCSIILDKILKRGDNNG